jgi:CheY-like chemotaxis protein
MARLAIIDDAEVQRRILSALLKKQHEVLTYASGGAFISALEAGETFDLILLDIEMPGIDGYETCRRVRASGFENPVVFVSAHDTAPERVEAYQSGADDFIVKPVSVDELQHKVGALLQQRTEIESLASQSRTAQQVAFTAMTSMGELGVLMDFMRQSASCTSPADVADALLTVLVAYGLHGVVQVRSGHAGTLVKSNAAQASPLQAVVMASLRDMGRIFVFGSRGIINYERISLLVNNLPTDDEERLGRLRDNLALLAEGAETRLAGIEAVGTLGSLQVDAKQTLASLRALLADATHRVHTCRQHSQQHVIEMFDTLTRLIDSYQITQIQRDTICEMIEEGIEESLRLHDESALAEGDFTRVIALLEKLANSNT